MGIEIERKFLLNDLDFLEGVKGKAYKQGYFVSDGNPGTRIRVAGDKGFITIKSRTNATGARYEFEYEIPLEDAEEMLDLFCKKTLVDKTRYEIMYEGFLWEIDVFHKSNDGLLIAEIELEDINQEFKMPKWVAQEVTGDYRYCNSYIAKHPFNEWN